MNQIINFLFSIFDKIFLLPLSFLWESIYRIRRFFYLYGVFHQHKFRVPIISVGNMTFGGTGKTPFTLWLSEFLDSIDRKVLILTRGYKGNLENSNGILRSSVRVGFNPNDFGDEPLLLARRLKSASIVVGKNRAQNLMHYFDEEKPDVVVLDDGYQHIKLHRDLNLALFDALLPIEKLRVAPRGYLREGLTALGHADMVVIGRADIAGPEKVGELREHLQKFLPTETPIAEFCYKPTGLFSSNFEKKMKVEELENRKVICVAGIASPKSFYSLVESFGADVIKKATFPDHHYFKFNEINDLLAIAQDNQALVVTTEKDIVKIRRVIDDERIVYLGIDVSFMSGEEVLKEKIRELV